MNQYHNDKQALTPRNIAEEIGGSLCLSTSKIVDILSEHGIVILCSDKKNNEIDTPLNGYANEKNHLEVVMVRQGIFKRYFHSPYRSANDIAVCVRKLIEGC